MNQFCDWIRLSWNANYLWSDKRHSKYLHIITWMKTFSIDFEWWNNSHQHILYDYSANIYTHRSYSNSSRANCNLISKIHVCTSLATSNYFIPMVCTRCICTTYTAIFDKFHQLKFVQYNTKVLSMTPF